MAIIHKTLEEQAKEALASGESYNCFATGNTYPVREDLKSYGFYWTQEDKSWTRESVSGFDKFIFEQKVLNGKWAGVVLEFVKEKESIISKKEIDDWFKSL